MKQNKWIHQSPKAWNKYYKRLNWLEKQINFLVKTYSEPSEIIAGILKLTTSPEWQYLAALEAQKMVKEISVVNAKNWREAAKKSRQGAAIHRELVNEFSANANFNQLILRNRKMIQSVPANIAASLQNQAVTHMMNGTRWDTFTDDIPKKSQNIMKRIMRTETAKTQAAVTQIRSQNAGIQLYIWRTVHDERVRGAHKHMDGVICSYKNPPSPENLAGKESEGNYGPGEIYNCRCYAEPIVDIDFIEAPYKVALNGSIQRLNKKQVLHLIESS